MREDMSICCDCEDIYKEKYNYGLRIIINARQAKFLMRELDEVMEGNDVHNNDIELVFMFPEEAITCTEWYHQMQKEWRDERNR